MKKKGKNLTRNSRLRRVFVSRTAFLKRLTNVLEDILSLSSPPRSRLNYPTVSGLRHQFDVIVMEGNTFYVVECKRRGMALIDQVFSFSSKILDYSLKEGFATRFRIKGIFLCTAKTNENIRTYALAYGISVVDATTLPIEVMIDRTKESDPMRQELSEIKKLLTLPQPEVLKKCKDGRELLQRFMICYEKWKGKGYA